MASHSLAVLDFRHPLVAAMASRGRGVRLAPGSIVVDTEDFGPPDGRGADPDCTSCVKSKFGRLTPSKRRCPRDRIGSHRDALLDHLLLGLVDLVAQHEKELRAPDDFYIPEKESEEKEA